MTWPFVCTVIPCSEPAWLFLGRESPIPERFCRYHAKLLFSSSMDWLRLVDDRV